MKNLLLVLLTIGSLHSLAQNVSINTDGSPAAPGNMLEIKKAVLSKVAIKTANYLDTAQLQFTNRNSSNEGTDLNIRFIREEGMYFTTSSDLANNINDSLFTLMRDGRIGIGTKTPVEKLDVIGSIRMRDGSQGDGKIMVSDAQGTGSWQPKTFGFAAKGSFPAISNKQNIPNATNTQLNIINSEEYDGRGVYNPATGVITIPEAGVYHIDVSITYSQASNGIYNLSLVSGGGTVVRLATQRVINSSFIDDLQLTISTDINCTAGQTLRLFTEQNSGNSQFVFGAFFSWISMHKLF